MDKKTRGAHKSSNLYFIIVFRTIWSTPKFFVVSESWQSFVLRPASCAKGFPFKPHSGSIYRNQLTLSQELCHKIIFQKWVWISIWVCFFFKFRSLLGVSGYWLGVPSWTFPVTAEARLRRAFVFITIHRISAHPFWGGFYVPVFLRKHQLAQKFQKHNFS